MKRSAMGQLSPFSLAAQCATAGAAAKRAAKTRGKRSIPQQYSETLSFIATRCNKGSIQEECSGGKSTPESIQTEPLQLSKSVKGLPPGYVLFVVPYPNSFRAFVVASLESDATGLSPFVAITRTTYGWWSRLSGKEQWEELYVLHRAAGWEDPKHTEGIEKKIQTRPRCLKKKNWS